MGKLEFREYLNWLKSLFVEVGKCLDDIGLRTHHEVEVGVIECAFKVGEDVFFIFIFHYSIKLSTEKILVI